MKGKAFDIISSIQCFYPSLNLFPDVMIIPCYSPIIFLFIFTIFKLYLNLFCIYLYIQNKYEYSTSVVRTIKKTIGR